MNNQSFLFTWNVCNSCECLTIFWACQINSFTYLLITPTNDFRTNACQSTWKSYFYQINRYFISNWFLIDIDRIQQKIQNQISNPKKCFLIIEAKFWHTISMFSNSSILTETCVGLTIWNSMTRDELTADYYLLIIIWLS